MSDSDSGSNSEVELTLSNGMKVGVSRPSSSWRTSENMRQSSEEKKSSVIDDRVQPTSTCPTHDQGHKINYSQRLPDRIRSIHEKKLFCDVEFIVGEERTRVQAHKLILALSSPVFTAMFYSELLNSQSVIEIPDCRPDAFQALIQYLYTEEAHLEAGNVKLATDTLYTARKYEVKGLEDQCIATLGKTINAENVFDVLNASNLLGLMNLEAQCWSFIEENVGPVLQIHLENMDADIMNLLLSKDTLNISEAVLFRHLLKWTELECENKELPLTPGNQLSVGGNLFKLIRFPTMTAAEFADSVVPTGILSMEQVVKVFTFLSTSPDKRLADGIEFSTKPRKSARAMERLFLTLDLESTTETAAEARTRSRRNRRARRRTFAVLPV